jgi:hypothetical protein
VTREERIEVVRDVLSGESFAVFAFAGADREPPYTSVMYFAETPALEVVFTTSPGTHKAVYTGAGNGVCVQVDTRGVGLENMSRFARVTLQGRLERVGDPGEVADLHALYGAKLPNARVFLTNPKLLTFRVSPLQVVFARGFGEHFELEFSEPSGPS